MKTFLVLLVLAIIDQALGTGYGGSPVVVAGNSKDEVSANALIPPTSSIALQVSNLSPDLSADSSYNREIVAKHRAFRVYADQDFQYECRDRINRKRRWHESTPDLEIGFNFTKYTVERAHSILRDIENKQEITKGRYALGESFFWYYDPNRYRSVEDAIDTWYGEYRNYDYNRPGFSAKTGGFTQLVWKNSREVSCAKIDYETRNHYKTLLVCNYYPAGNVQGQFLDNVLPVRRTGGGGNRPDDNDYPNWPNRPNRPSRPDYDPRPPNRPDNDRPNRPSRPDYDRPDRPNRPDNDRPNRPEYEPRPPNRPERPDYDPRPPNRPDYDPRPPNRPERPDYDPRPPSRPDRPRPPYDEDRPNRPGGGGGYYPTHPVLVTGSQTLTSPGEKVKPLNPTLEPIPIPAISSVEPTPVQYAPAVIAPQTAANDGQVYQPVEAVLILPQYRPAAAAPGVGEPPVGTPAGNPAQTSVVQ